MRRSTHFTFIETSLQRPRLHDDQIDNSASRWSLHRGSTVFHLISITLPRFSVNGWKHTSGNTPVPVVVEARPQSAADLTGGIIHSYSFLDFYFIDPDFKPQREIWCRGAVNPPPLPKLPRRFDVNLEYLNSNSTRIWGTRVSRVLHGWYDETVNAFARGKAKWKWSVLPKNATWRSRPEKKNAVGVSCR